MTALATELICPPRWHHIPPHVGSYGSQAAGLMAAVGLPLDPEQELVVEGGLAYDERGRLVSTVVGASGPRQCFKSHCGKALSLADLVLLHQPQGLWTAHRRDTSDEVFRNDEGTGLADLFDNFDFLRRLVDRNGITDSDGEKSIVLRPHAAGEPRASLRFKTRTDRDARGLTGRRVTFDEALFLKPSMVAAMLPVLSARSMTGQIQLRYLGSPGVLTSQVWREVRDRGRAGTTRAMAWIEWAAEATPCGREDCRHAPGDPGCALDREDLIRQANLAIDRRIDIRYVLETERVELTPVDFMRERLGWWQDPPNTTGGDLDTARWASLVDFDVARGKQLFYGVDVDGDGIAWIGIAWRRPDGHVQVMLDEPKDRARVSAMTAPDRLKDLVKEYGGRVVLGGPAARIEKDLTGVRSQLISGTEFAQACAEFEDLLKAGRIHHQEQDDLDLAVSLAKWRNVGTAGERAWQLRDATGVGPLAAVTRALAGLLLTPAAPPAAPLVLTASVEGGLTDSIADMTF